MTRPSCQVRDHVTWGRGSPATVGSDAREMSTEIDAKSVRNELYVDAARASGLYDWSIIARHILSVVRVPIIIRTAAIAGVAIAIRD